MSAGSGLFINVGSGPDAPEGWVCLDGSWQAWFAHHPVLAWVARCVTGRPVGHWNRGIVCRDARAGLHFPDASAAVVFSSHLIEHLHRREALELLRECRRVLKPGGICRIVTPDLSVLVDRYVEARANGGARGAADALQAAMLLRAPGGTAPSSLLGAYRRRTDFDSHKWIYDAPGLCALFEEAGFSGACVRGYLESAIPAARLAQVEQASRVLNGEGMCVEAVKG